MSVNEGLITFTVPGPPVPWARAARKGSKHSFTPLKQKRYKEDVQWLARTAMKGQDPFQGPIVCDIEFGMPVPISYSPAKRQACLDGELWPIYKPDIDNLAKIIKDALNEIVYDDDSQVVGLRLKKFYSDNPGVEIVVARMVPEAESQE